MKCTLSPLIALASILSIAVPLSTNAQHDPVNLLWTQYGLAVQKEIQQLRTL